MTRTFPSHLPPNKSLKPISLKSLYLIVENDYALKRFRKRGLLNRTSHLKYQFLQASYVVTDPSKQQSLRTLKQVVNKNIRRLSLHFYTLNEAQNAFIQHYISRLSALRYLKVTVRTSDNVDDRVLTQLSRSISRIPGVKESITGFGESNSITVKGIEAYFRKTTYVFNLTSFGFHICESPYLDDDLLIQAAKYLGKLCALKELSLSFINCYRIRDKGLGEISGLFPKLPGLEVLRLQLKGCYEITDSGIEDFGLSLGVVRELKDLELNLESCFEITEKGVSCLLKGISSLNWGNL